MSQYKVNVRLMTTSKKIIQKQVTSIKAKDVMTAKILAIGAVVMDEHMNGKDRYVKIASISVEVEE